MITNLAKIGLPWAWVFEDLEIMWKKKPKGKRKKFFKMVKIITKRRILLKSMQIKKGDLRMIFNIKLFEWEEAEYSEVSPSNN